MNILITGIANEFDAKLAAAFVREGHRVFAITEKSINGVTPLPANLMEAAEALKNDPGHIDLYIDTSDERSPFDTFTVRSGLDETVMHCLYEANAIRPMALLEAFLPLLEAGSSRRLCFLTSAQASINETRDIDGLGYKMAKAALHNFLQITRNVLAPRGYTLRAFDPLHGEVLPEMAAEAALHYFIRRRGIENDETLRDDEGNLVFRDACGRQHPW